MADKPKRRIRRRKPAPPDHQRIAMLEAQVARLKEDLQISRAQEDHQLAELLAFVAGFMMDVRDLADLQNTALGSDDVRTVLRDFLQAISEAADTSDLLAAMSERFNRTAMRSVEQMLEARAGAAISTGEGMDAADDSAPNLSGWRVLRDGREWGEEYEDAEYPTEEYDSEATYDPSESMQEFREAVARRQSRRRRGRR